jgi:hypothetical protein
MVSAHRPDLRDPVHTLLERYARLRYGPRASGEEIEAFSRAVARLSLPRTAPA